MVFWCHFMWKNRIRRNFSKKAIFGGLHPKKLHTIPILAPKLQRTFFFDKLTYIHTQYWHFLNLNSIPSNFCSYTFFRLKHRYGVTLNFRWIFVGIWTIFRKNWQRTSFVGQTNIHFFPIKASLQSFIEILLKFRPFFPKKLIKSIIFWNKSC